ncbi:MAG TPA: hypothetical protein DCL54_03850 [Alphaproteobacteria bacterium]|nr:hypothetical protein [Alphaproteobacteria bacterium]
MDISSFRARILPRGLAEAALALGSLAVAAAATAAPQLLGNFDRWDAYKSTEAQGVVCYVVAEPQSKEPAGAKRDPVFLVINTWPAKSIKHQPNVQIGYPFKDGSEASAQVGSDKFSFFTQGESAWIKANEDEVRFVEALKNGSEVTIQGVSRRGTLTTDTYALKGISSALQKAEEACK